MTVDLSEISSVDKQPIISFFSGCGSFDLGFSEAGFSVELALDIDPTAVKTYNHNSGKTICNVADLAQLDGQSVIKMYSKNCGSGVPLGVIGGAPCQTFSIGNRYFHGDDARHLLPRRYACILRILNLKYDLDFFVFENVKGIKSANNIREYWTIKRLFSRANFRLFEGELDAADFGVAQRRLRVFIVGLNKKKYPHIRFKFPEPSTTTPITVAGKLRGLPEPLLFRRGVKRCDIPHHPNHWTMYPRSDKFTDGTLLKNPRRGDRSVFSIGISQA